MIKIEDNDSPITAADKLIHGTRPYNPTPAAATLSKAITGDENASDTVDMYDLEELKEIADYLMVYYNSHADRD